MAALTVPSFDAIADIFSRTWEKNNTVYIGAVGLVSASFFGNTRAFNKLLFMIFVTMALLYHVLSGDEHFIAVISSTAAWIAENETFKYINELKWLEPAWQNMLNNYSEFTIVSIFTFIIHESAYFGFSLPWYLIDKCGWFKKYKIQADKPNDPEVVWRCFKRLVFNHTCIQFPMMLLTHWALNKLGFSLALPLPTISSLIYKVAGCMIIEDFYFYWVHRALHHKRIYKYIHKVHHTHAAPFGIAAEYAHPVETVLLGIGTILGPLVFSRHLLDLWVWLVVRLWETIEDHSGYELPFIPTNWIPFWGGPVHHDFHHKEFEGNYASMFTFWDWFFGTDKQFRLAQEEKKKNGLTSWVDLVERTGAAETAARAAAEERAAKAAEKAMRAAAAKAAALPSSKGISAEVSSPVVSKARSSPVRSQRDASAVTPPSSLQPGSGAEIKQRSGPVAVGRRASRSRSRGREAHY